MDGDRAAWACWELASLLSSRGDLRELWRPRQSEGILTMQECVPVFSDLSFFQGNMEIEILCEVLWCFLSLRSIQFKPEYCEG